MAFGGGAQRRYGNSQIQSAVLLDYRMLATLFPDATIHRERFLGLVKSLIAVRNAA